MEKKYKRLVNNSIWTLIGNSGSKLLGFLLLPFYTKWLGTSGFGESDLVTTYSSFLLGIMTFCTADGIFVFTKNEFKDNKRIYFTSTLIFIFFLFGIWTFVWFVFDGIFAYWNIQNSFVDNLWLILGIVVSSFFQTFCQQFALSLDKMKIYSFTGIIYCIFTLIFSYLLIPYKGVKGYVLAIILANVLTSCYTFFFSHAYCYFNWFLFRKENVILLLKYSIPLIPNGIMWWLVSALNRPIMEYNLDYSAIGIFAVSNRFPSVVTMIFTVFSVAWNISVFEEYEKKDYKIFYQKIFRMLFLIITIVASFIMVFSEQLIQVLVAHEFLDSWKYMVILIIGAVLSCMSGFFGTNFSVVRQSKYFFYSSIWGAISSIVLNFLLIPVWGLWGASFSVLISFAVIMGSRYKYSKKYVDTNMIPEISKYLIALFLVSICIFVFNILWMRVFTTIIILCLLSIKDRDIVIPIIRKITFRS